MILLDTHAWVWWLSSPKTLSLKARKEIKSSEHQDALLVSVISCWEVAMLVSKGRLAFSMDVEEWINISLRVPHLRLVELNPKIAVLSTRLEGNPPNDPVDRILIATAKVMSCPIITKDNLIRKYSYVKSVWS